MRKDKIATAAYHREWYEQNKERRRKQIYEHRARTKATHRQFIWDYLTIHPCVDCGNDDPRVLEFDHLEDKDKAVTQGIEDGWSKSRLLEEIDKCEVRCANCHRIKTQQRQNSWRAKFHRAE